MKRTRAKRICAKRMCPRVVLAKLRDPEITLEAGKYFANNYRDCIRSHAVNCSRFSDTTWMVLLLCENESNEDESDEEGSDEEASDEEASDEEASDEEASDEEASDEKSDHYGCHGFYADHFRCSKCPAMKFRTPNWCCLTKLDEILKRAESIHGLCVDKALLDVKKWKKETPNDETSDNDKGS